MMAESSQQNIQKDIGSGTYDTKDDSSLNNQRDFHSGTLGSENEK